MYMNSSICDIPKIAQIYFHKIQLVDLQSTDANFLPQKFDKCLAKKALGLTDVKASVYSHHTTSPLTDLHFSTSKGNRQSRHVEHIVEYRGVFLKDRNEGPAILCQ